MVEGPYSFLTIQPLLQERPTCKKFLVYFSSRENRYALYGVTRPGMVCYVGDLASFVVVAYLRHSRDRGVSRTRKGRGKRMTVVDIDRRHKLPYEAFAHEYLFPNKPVILSGALEGWQAVANWTPDYFKDKYGTMNLSIDGEDYTMAEFIDHVNSSTP